MADYQRETTISKVGWLEFTRQHWGHNWGLCRNTASNRSRYDRCVSREEYHALQATYRKEHTADALRDPLTHRYDGNLTADLFEALEDLIASIAAYEKKLNTPIMVSYTPAIEQARAAIAKARGEG
jgi:hypothetical protein